MAPVWAIVFGTVVFSMFTIRDSGRRLLERGYYAQADTCQVGELKYLAAMKIFRAVSADVAAREKPEGAAAILAASTLGARKGDPRLAELRTMFGEAIRVCPILRGAHEALAAVEWWDGNEALAHYRLGLEHRVAGETSLARTEFETAAALDPADGDILLACAEELAREFRPVEAAAMLREAPESVRESAAAMRIFAREAGTRRAWDEAIAFARRGLELEPGHGLAVDDLLRFAANGDTLAENCRWVADNLRKSVAPEARSWHSLSQNLYHLGDDPAALEAIDGAIAIAPNSVNLYMDKALILYRLGRDQEAVRTIELAVEKDYRWYFKLLEDARFEPLRPATQERFGAVVGGEQ